MHNVESCVCEEKNKKECTKYGKGVDEERVSLLRAIQKKWTKFRSGFFVIIEL